MNSPLNLNNFLKDELIGLNVDIIRCTNPYVQNIKGVVVDETKNTLIIKQDKANKVVNKENTILKFELKGKSIKVNGSKLIGRPEDRVKEKRKRKW